MTTRLAWPRSVGLGSFGFTNLLLAMSTSGALMGSASAQPPSWMNARLLQGRSTHAMAYDHARQRVVLFGGHGDDFLSDSWEWDGSGWTQRSPAASPISQARKVSSGRLSVHRLALVTAGLLAVQDRTARESCLGVVLASDGAPVAEAEVVLVSSLLRHAASLEGDVIRVRTDAKGHFRSSLLENRLYTAWASWVDGRPCVSGVVEEVSGGQLIRLVEAQTSRQTTELRLIGADAWKEHGPLRFRVRVFTDNRLAFDVEARGEAVELAALPDCVSIDVLGAAGHTLTEAFLEPAALRLPPPSSRLQVTVVDEAGKPVADARVGLNLLGEAASTDARGRVALSLTQAESMLSVTKSGFREARVPIPIAVELERSIRVELVKSAFGPHRVLGRDGRPVAGATVLASWWNQTGDEPGPTTSTRSGPYVAKTGADGSYVVPGPRDPARMREPAATVLLSDEDRASFGVPPDFPLPPESLHHRGSLDVDLTDYSVASLELVAAGSPAAGVRVSGAVPGPADRAVYATNRRGRVCLLLRRGSHRIEAWHPELGFALEAVEIAPGARNHSTKRVELSPLGTIAGRVRTANGGPVAGADIWLAEPIGDLHDTVKWNFGSYVNSRLLRGRTDSEGRFRLRFAPLADFRWRLWVRSGGKRVQHEIGEQGGEDVEIVLR